MTYFYSASKRGFFHPAINPRDTIPADAVAITEQDHAALMSAQSSGKAILPDPDGRPIATDQPLPDAEVAAGLLRARRDRLLRASDRTQLIDFQMSEKARAAWAVYRNALRDLPQNFGDDPASVVWPTPPQE